MMDKKRAKRLNGSYPHEPTPSCASYLDNAVGDAATDDWPQKASTVSKSAWGDDEISNAEETAMSSHHEVTTEYSQPDVCPYKGEPVTILISYSLVQYTIPRYVIDRHPSLKSELGNYTPEILNLMEADEDTGHTIMHYLYTGTYQTLKPFPPHADSYMTRNKLEYTRSMLVYRAAMRYQLYGLSDLAKQYIAVFDRNMDILDIINLARENSPQITEDEWLSAYLTSRIQRGFHEDEKLFEREGFSDEIGTSREFDAFLWKLMVQNYREKISALRSEVVWKVGSVPAQAMQPSVSVPQSEIGDGEVSTPHAKCCKDVYMPPHQRGDHNKPHAQFQSGSPEMKPLRIDDETYAKLVYQRGGYERLLLQSRGKQDERPTSSSAYNSDWTPSQSDTTISPKSALSYWGPAETSNSPRREEYNERSASASVVGDSCTSELTPTSEASAGWEAKSSNCERCFDW